MKIIPFFIQFLWLVLVPTFALAQEKIDNEDAQYKALLEITPPIKVKLLVGGGSMQYNLTELESIIGLKGNERFPRYASLRFEGMIRFSLRNGFFSLYYQAASVSTAKDNYRYNVFASNVGLQIGYSILLLDEDWIIYPFIVGGNNNSTFTASQQISFSTALLNPVSVFTSSRLSAILGIGTGTEAQIWKWKRGDIFLPISSLVLGFEVSYLIPIGTEAYGSNLLTNVSDIPFMAPNGWQFKISLGLKF
jgi:hypothetical protein